MLVIPSPSLLYFSYGSYIVLSNKYHIIVSFNSHDTNIFQVIAMKPEVTQKAAQLYFMSKSELLILPIHKRNCICTFQHLKNNKSD